MTMKELYTKIGKLLRIERTRREIQLEDLAVELKISEANLEAIEDGDASRLPSELYFKLFAKSYAEALGIDYEATVEAIEQDLMTAEPDEEKADATVESDSEDSSRPKASKGIPDTGSRRQLKTLLYLIAAVVLLFLVVIAVNELFLKESDGEVAIDSTTVTETESVMTPATPTNELAGYDWEVPSYHEPDSIKLTLLARSESWASVFVDGDTAVYQTLRPNRRYEAAAQYRMRVSVGIPSVVNVELNGQPVNLRDPESGRISGVQIDQVNLEQYLARPLTYAPPAAKAEPAQPRPSESSVVDTTSVGSETPYGTRNNENESQDSL
jgi:transcriptional regulator with XRE-family HTH domain